MSNFAGQVNQQRLAQKGRGPDNAKRGGRMAHVAHGDLVIPAKLIDLEPGGFAKAVQMFRKHGTDWRTHMVGMGRKNPKTGLEEFAWDDEEDNSAPLEDQPTYYFDTSEEAAEYGAYNYGNDDQPSGDTGDGGNEMVEIDSSESSGGGDFEFNLPKFDSTSGGWNAFNAEMSEPPRTSTGAGDYNMPTATMPDMGLQPVDFSPGFKQDFGSHFNPPDPEPEPEVDELGIPRITYNGPGGAGFDTTLGPGGIRAEAGRAVSGGTSPAPPAAPPAQAPPTPHWSDANSPQTQFINQHIAPKIPVIGDFIGATTGTGITGDAVNAVGDFFNQHADPNSVYNDPIEGGSDNNEVDELGFPRSPTGARSTAQTTSTTPTATSTGGTSPTTGTVATTAAGTPGLPGGPDPWAGVFDQQEAQNAANAATGNSISANPAGSASSAGGFSRPAEMPSPSFLGMSGGMTGLQQRSMLATYGMNSDDGMWRDDLSKEYFKNQLLRQLIRDDGTIGDMRELLPIEHQYLQQVMGLEYAPNDTASLIKALGGPMGQPAAAQVRPNAPHGSIPLPNGGHMAPSGDGGFSIVPPDGQMGPQAVVYLDRDGNFTPDRSQAYLPGSISSLQNMMGSADANMPQMVSMDMVPQVGGGMGPSVGGNPATGPRAPMGDGSRADRNAAVQAGITRRADPRHLLSPDPTDHYGNKIKFDPATKTYVNLDGSPVQNRWDAKASEWGFSPELVNYLKDQERRSAGDMAPHWTYDPATKTFKGGTMGGSTTLTLDQMMQRMSAAPPPRGPITKTPGGPAVAVPRAESSPALTAKRNQLKKLQAEAAKNPNARSETGKSATERVREVEKELRHLEHQQARVSQARGNNRRAA